MHSGNAMASALGFTGTRGELTDWQRSMTHHLLNYHFGLGFLEFHHGDCVGADKYAAQLALSIGYYVICHPPDNPHYRAWVPYHEIWTPEPYLVRNRDIAATADAGLVVPNSEQPRPHSGTWYTMTQFTAKGIPYWTVTPTSYSASPGARTPSPFPAPIDPRLSDPHASV